MAALMGGVSGKSEPVLEHDADHAEGGAPQRIGVLAAGRLLVDRPEGAERVELVAERDHDRDRGSRDAIVRPLRFVMLFDRRGDAGFLALGCCVIAAHQALQFGELADHLGHQVGLGEPGGARGQFDVRPDLRRDFARERLDAVDALGLRAELLVENDPERLELGEALVERLLGFVLVVGQVVKVGQPEMPGVGEARPHDPGVAGRDRRAAVARDEVRDQDEAVCEPAVGVLQHEALLVGADSGADDLRRNVEKVRLEFADQRDRPFDQPCDLLEQSLVLDEFEPLGEGEALGVGKYDPLAPIEVEYDLRLLQRLCIVLKPAHSQGSRRHEAMSEGHVPGRKAVDVEGHDFRRLVLGRDRADDSAQRPHPAQSVGLGGSRAPAHRFRPREGPDDRGNDLGERFACRAAGLLDRSDIELALLRVLLDPGVLDARKPRTLQKPLDGRLGGADAGPLALLPQSRLRRRQANHVQSEPPWSGEGLRALINQVSVDQRVGDEALQIIRSLPLHTGRDFFAEQFEKEIRHSEEPRKGFSKGA